MKRLFRFEQLVRLERVQLVLHHFLSAFDPDFAAEAQKGLARQPQDILGNKACSWKTCVVQRSPSKWGRKDSAILSSDAD